MAKNYFSSQEPDTPAKVYREILLWFKERQYSVDSTETDHVYLIQATKSGMIRTFLGTNLAFKVKIYESDNLVAPNEFIVETSTGKWVQNLAGAGITAMFTSGLTILTGVAGAGWALMLENELVTYIEDALKFPRLKQQAPIPSIATSSQLNENGNPLELMQQLEKALEEGILTQEEFQAKRAALEVQTQDYEIEVAIQQKLDQLATAFSNGILSADEYEAKVKVVEAAAREQMAKECHQKQKAQKLAKLREALKNGILTEAEYQEKMNKI